MSREIKPDRGEASETKSREKGEKDFLRQRFVEKLIPCLRTDRPKTKTLKEIIKDYETEYMRISIKNYNDRKIELDGLERDFNARNSVTRSALNKQFSSIKDLRVLSESIREKDNEIIKESVSYYAMLYCEDKSIKSALSAFFKENVLIEGRNQKENLMKTYKSGIEKLLRIKANLDRHLS
jgi:hypothetical protein